MNDKAYKLNNEILILKSIVKDQDKEIAELKQQLAEKEEEYQSFKKIADENVNYLKNRILEETKNYNQDKISFAVEQLEKVKYSVLDFSNGYWRYFMKNGKEYMTSSDLNSCLKEYIDDLIKELKGDIE